MVVFHFDTPTPREIRPGTGVTDFRVGGGTGFCLDPASVQRPELSAVPLSAKIRNSPDSSSLAARREGDCPAFRTRSNMVDRDG